MAAVVCFLTVISTLTAFCSVLSQEVVLSRISRYEMEGQETMFECRNTDAAYRQLALYVVWYLDDDVLDTQLSFRESRMGVTLDRDQSGSTLACHMSPPNAKASLTLNVMYPPEHVEMDLDSSQVCDDDADCSAEVMIGRPYRFTCRATASNPVSAIGWSVETREPRNTEQSKIVSHSRRSHPDEEDWDASSQMLLQIGPQHRSSSVVCQVLFPEEIYKEIVMHLVVVDKLAPPSQVTLDANSTLHYGSDTKCSTEVAVGRLYRFTCNASGSNPASSIVWSINRQGRRGVEQSKIDPHSNLSYQDENSDWDTWSQILLQIGPEHRFSSVVCRVLFPNDTVYKEITTKLLVMVPPRRVTLDVNTTRFCGSNMDCRANVVIGQVYRFTCNATGSNPAGSITWLIATQGRRGVEQSKIAPHSNLSYQDENNDWDTWSQILLQIGPKNHLSSVVCSVLFPDDTVYKKITTKLLVMVPPRRVTLDVNTTWFCDSADCSADVAIGRSYRFTCNAQGSNPATDITWWISTKGRQGVEQSRIAPLSSRSHQDENYDWDTSSQILLHVLPMHRFSNVTCRVLYPDNSVTHKKMVMKLLVTDHRETWPGHAGEWSMRLEMMAFVAPPAAVICLCVVVLIVYKTRKPAQPTLLSSQEPVKEAAVGKLSKEVESPAPEGEYMDIDSLHVYQSRISTLQVGSTRL